VGKHMSGRRRRTLLCLAGVRHSKCQSASSHHGPRLAMLPLTDPLWEKLDAASDKDIPKLLSQLAETWDNGKAQSLLWDVLWQRDNCYGATFAAAPHLLRLAEPDANREQRYGIALFLGHIAGGYAAEPSQALCTLPETLEGWERKLDRYRSFVATFE